MLVHGHRWINFKSSEMLCPNCGYVLWRCTTEEEIVKAMTILGGGVWNCPKIWHGLRELTYPEKEEWKEIVLINKLRR